MSAPDEHLARALASHLDPAGGTPYWLDRQRELGLDLRSEVRTGADLPLLGPFRREDLLERPLTDLVPRRLRDRLPELVLAESGGTTGRPIRSVYARSELEEGFGTPFLLAGRARGFPRGGGWLFVGPTGPHVIGRAARLLARLHGSPEPFAVDLDPRWARAQTPGSLGQRLYTEHVLDQALDILARERIEVLFVTPPVALALADALSEEARCGIRGVHLGGMVVSSDVYLAVRAAFPEAVHLPGYGNSMFGILVEATEPTRRPDGGLDLDYVPLPGRLVVRVVREEGGGVDLAQEVEPGDTGRVVLSRLDETFLLPNMVERDRAERIEMGEEVTALGLAAHGLRNPAPVRPEESERGLY